MKLAVDTLCVGWYWLRLRLYNWNIQWNCGLSMTQHYRFFKFSCNSYSCQHSFLAFPQDNISIWRMNKVFSYEEMGINQFSSQERNFIETKNESESPDFCYNCVFLLVVLAATISAIIFVVVVYTIFFHCQCSRNSKHQLLDLWKNSTNQYEEEIKIVVLLLLCPYWILKGSEVRNFWRFLLKKRQ